MPHSIDRTCEGCSACAHQCPVGAITGTFKQRYDIDAGLCIDCGVCGVVCPVESVHDARGAIVPHLRRTERPRPVVHADLCNGCAVCLAYCPFDCRAVVGPVHHGVSFLADPRACVSCGECARCCIKGAITMDRLDLRGYDPDAERAGLAERLDGTGTR